jgi:hypothetical protein
MLVLVPVEEPRPSVCNSLLYSIPNVFELFVGEPTV